MLRLIRARLGADDDSGAIAVVTAIAMVVVLSMAALVIDIGAAQSRQAQLQEAADAAALALAQGCATTATTTPLACAAPVRSGALATATTLAQHNLNDGSVAVGAPTFTSTSVTVTVTSTQQGFFAPLLGTDRFGLTATATAQWTQPVIPLPLAYHECSLPDPSPTTLVFLRSDILTLPLGDCGLGSVTGLLGARWAVGSGCSFDIDLLTYVNGVLSNILPSECVSMVGGIIGHDVIVPVYGRVLVPIVINGVLMGMGYEVTKYAVIRITGYDFQSLTVLGVPIVGGPKSMPAGPQCPSILGIEALLCQGLQGYLTGFLTPDEAAQRIVGVKLIA